MSISGQHASREVPPRPGQTHAGLIPRAAIAKGGRPRPEPHDGRKLGDRPFRLCGLSRSPRLGDGEPGAPRSCSRPSGSRWRFLRSAQAPNCRAWRATFTASAIVPSRKAASPNATRCSSANPATQRRPLIDDCGRSGAGTSSAANGQHSAPPWSIITIGSKKMAITTGTVNTWFQTIDSLPATTAPFTRRLRSHMSPR